jgi:hypothetical protein
LDFPGCVFVPDCHRIVAAKAQAQSRPGTSAIEVWTPANSVLNGTDWLLRTNHPKLHLIGLTRQCQETGLLFACLGNGNSSTLSTKAEAGKLNVKPEWLIDKENGDARPTIR